MPRVEEVERLLADVRKQVEDAEAMAGHARKDLARLTSGITALEELDPRQVLATAATLAQEVYRLRELREAQSRLRGLLV